MKKYQYVFGVSVLSLLLSFTVANAATYLVGNPNGQGAVYVTLGLDKSIYQPGENIVARDIYMQSYSPIVNQVSLAGGTNGSWVSILLESISQGQSIFGNERTIGIAPSVIGTHQANFTAGYNLGEVPRIVVSASVTSGPSSYYPNDTPGTGRCTVILNSSNIASQSISGTVEIRNSLYPSTESLDTITLTIPAWSTQSNMYVMEPSSQYAGSSWCSKEWNYVPTITNLSRTTVDGKDVVVGNVGQE